MVRTVELNAVLVSLNTLLELWKEQAVNMIGVAQFVGMESFKKDM